MARSSKAQEIYDQLDLDNPRMGDIKKIAAKIKKDHELAMELWGTGEFTPRLLAVLILDKSTLDQDMIEKLVGDMAVHDEAKRNRLSEWFMANQLMKSKKTTALLESWANHKLPTLRRLYWYHQARLRWTGQKSPENTPHLVSEIKANLEKETPEVQWAINFTAGWIGVHDPQYRSELVALGEKVGLYEDEPKVRGCTPNYLPGFIEVEVAKLEK